MKCSISYQVDLLISNSSRVLVPIESA